MKTCDLNVVTIDELWQEAETWLDGIADTVSHRCYREYSMIGARAILIEVRKHLTWIDRVLLEIEIRRAGKTRGILRRVEEGMTTVADAEFLREILGIKAEKVVPNPEEWPFR